MVLSERGGLLAAVGASPCVCALDSPPLGRSDRATCSEFGRSTPATQGAYLLRISLLPCSPPLGTLRLMGASIFGVPVLADKVESSPITGSVIFGNLGLVGYAVGSGVHRTIANTA